jgi:hypothetical protein
MNRTDIARELLIQCPPDSFSDYQAIVEALERGVSNETILFMPEVFRWPKTYRWLKAILESDMP